jgi:hypothetical protein
MVNFWSLFQVFVMLNVVILELIFIKSLFIENCAIGIFLHGFFE